MEDASRREAKYRMMNEQNRDATFLSSEYGKHKILITFVLEILDFLVYGFILILDHNP